MSSSVQLRDREHPHVLAGRVPAVVEVPQLGALAARVPLAERVAQREDPLLGAGALLVAAPAAEDRVEPVLGDRVEQRLGLQRVAGAVRAFGEPSVVDPVLHAAPRAGAGPTWPPVVAELDHFRVVVPGVDVQQRERHRRGPNALAARCTSSVESLPPENRITGRSSSPATSRKMWMASDSSASRASRSARRSLDVCSPHSIFPVPAQRPERGSAPGSGLAVHGAQPIDG